MSLALDDELSGQRPADQGWSEPGRSPSLDGGSPTIGVTDDVDMGVRKHRARRPGYTAGIARLAASALLLIVLSACAAEESPRDIRQAARSLVPTGSRIVARQDGACVQLADFPSCVEFRFVAADLSEEERIELVRKAAQEHAWDTREEEVFARETWLYFERGDYEATVRILRDEWLASCRVRRDCPDTVRVLRN